ncbi:hypothetical protein C8J56DRAFT_919218 [Mycena floridula]|nr:hypothetical protein C8J56DRAFT_919218 [Mycena floridula]
MEFNGHVYSEDSLGDEDWSQYEDQVWKFSIVSEEVLENGDSIYEAEWEGWNRPDSSSTTWGNAKVGTLVKKAATKEWNQQQRDHRNQLADQSTDIELWSTFDICNEKTRLRAQGFDEKLAKPRPSKSLTQLTEEMLAKKLQHSSNTVTASSSRVMDVETRSHRRRSISSSSSSPDPLLYSPRKIKPLPAKKAKSPEKDRRREIVKWNHATQAAGAVKIVFVSSIDDNREIPELQSGFTYLEAEYVQPSGFEADEGAYVRCTSANCASAEDCECQLESALVDQNGKKRFAYTEEGLYDLSIHKLALVIECNKYCSCSEGCPNRIVQRPREIPIEVFKTPKCGWGVRSSRSIEKGKVLGVYTGKLIPRREAMKLKEKTYCFDLDWIEELEGEGWSVDARAHGNWTRFINHSCDPNVLVYGVDLTNMVTPYYLAFVAAVDIPAGVEFRFDYDPSLADEPRSEKAPVGAQQCQCGAERCRGWVRC